MNLEESALGVAFALMMCLNSAVDPSSPRTLLYRGLDTPGAIAIANTWYEGPSTEMILRRILENKIPLKAPLSKTATQKLTAEENELVERMLKGVEQAENIKKAHKTIRSAVTEEQYAEFCKLERKLEGPVILLREDYTVRFKLTKQQQEKLKAITTDYRSRVRDAHWADFTSPKSSDELTKQFNEKLERLTKETYRELFRELTLEQRVQWINLLRE